MKNGLAKARLADPGVLVGSGFCFRRVGSGYIEGRIRFYGVSDPVLWRVGSGFMEGRIRFYGGSDPVFMEGQIRFMEGRIRFMEGQIRFNGGSVGSGFMEGRIRIYSDLVLLYGVAITFGL